MGCCLLTLVLLGASRLADVIWWVVRPGYWQAAFVNWPIVWWAWPTLGIIFLPWTTLMYVIVYPSGVSFFEWILLAVSLLIDISSYGSGYRANAQRA